ncbi:hypothetical protein TrST_g8515 [Triparma strigata]|uniref:Uncharacterized protein n=1 Tax=Triparma strigata TaxID=1606541 RepID=A0A9W7BJG0_9STRA|nr:hypothetical protein TrST_g8515 [Triparma strigata]
MDGYRVEVADRPPEDAMTEDLRDILDREDESAARDAFLKENTVQALDLSSKTEGASGIIRVCEFESDILQLQSPDDIAHEGNSITVLYNYPLSTCGPSTLESCFKSWEFPITSPGGGSLTVSDVVSEICVKYREIYEEEEATRKQIPLLSTSAPSPTSYEPLNRPMSDGKYGIWGHHLEELHISDVICIGGGVFTVIMESEPVIGTP